MATYSVPGEDTLCWVDGQPIAPPQPWLAGEWDYRGRFTVGEGGRASCCASIREPSNAFPFSQWRHVHTAKHRRTWEAENMRPAPRKDGTE